MNQKQTHWVLWLAAHHRLHATRISYRMTPNGYVMLDVYNGNKLITWYIINRKGLIE